MHVTLHVLEYGAFSNHLLWNVPPTRRAKSQSTRRNYDTTSYYIHVVGHNVWNVFETHNVAEENWRARKIPRCPSSTQLIMRETRESLFSINDIEIRLNISKDVRVQWINRGTDRCKDFCSRTKYSNRRSSSPLLENGWKMWKNLTFLALSLKLPGPRCVA